MSIEQTLANAKLGLLLQSCHPNERFVNTKKHPGPLGTGCSGFCLAAHHAAGAALAAGTLLAIGRILLHPLLVALHICLRRRCAFFFLCTSSEQSGSDDDGEAKGDLFHNGHYSGRMASVSLMHPTLDVVLPDIDVAVVLFEREVPRD